MGTFTAVVGREDRDEIELLALIRVPGHLLEILLMSACLPALCEATERDAILSSASRRKLSGTVSLQEEPQQTRESYLRMVAEMTAPAVLEPESGGWLEWVLEK